MSKKKNTLKDLNEFLKQQAATLVSPEKLSDKIEAQTPASAPEKEAEAVHAAPAATHARSVSSDTILDDLKQLAGKEGLRFKPQFYDLIIGSLETQKSYSPEDRMLINTVLYLKSGERWKETIREFWKKNDL